MNINEFKSGIYKQQYEYKSFLPERISNQDWIISDPNVNKVLSDADIKLGELNAFSQFIPDIDFFISMHIHKEATTSSRIEGTETNMEESLQKIEFIDPEKREDWHEVQCYIKAMNYAIQELDALPLSGRLLQQTHKILLEGVRGKRKLPGEFRKSQNWIGGASLNDAIFIPPHHEDLPELIKDLEIFLNDEEHPIPHLIRIAIAHYQFETIHPFLDGNGRIGRLLITLYLVSKGLLVKPTLYLSDFFERHKTLYYDNLTRVRTHNDLTQWVKFFLEGIRQTSENSIETFKSIIALRSKSEQKLLSLGRKIEEAQTLLEYLYSHPIIDVQQVAKKLSIHNTTAMRLINDFTRLKILEEITGYKRNRIYKFNEYIKLFL